MFKKAMVAAFFVLALVSMVAAQDAKTVISNVSKASGYDNLKSIEYSGPSGLEGTAMGQAQSAAKGWPHFTLKNYTRYIDLSAGTGQQNSLRSRPGEPDGQLAGGGGLAPQNEAPNTTLINANGTFAQKLDINLSPPGFVKLASAASNATVTQRSVQGKKYTVVSFPVEQKAPSGVAYTISGYIDDQNMVAKVDTKIEDALIGDMLVEQTYSGYKDFGGVKFPSHIVQTRAGLAWTDLTVSDVKANGPAPAAVTPAGRGGGAGAGAGAGGGRGAAAPEGRGGGAGAGRGAGDGRGGAPAAGRGAAPEGRGAAPEGRGGGGGRGAAPAPTAKKLADGIYMITGGYRSVAVEMKDHVVLIEAPQSDATTTAIIEEVKKTFPSKPIKYVVNTHTHSDHSGGLRVAVAEGATVITHESNKQLYEKWFTNPRTLLMPDKLSQSEKRAKFEYMGEKKVLKDNTNTIELYHLRGVVHGEDMIVAYLPKIKTVVEADTFNAPAANAPPPAQINGLEKLFASELDRLKIDYTTIIPIHAPNPDREITKADLLKNIGKGN
jgi:glyoxylase-like metal-dependent hydrolase (beta-lactamase superfamily II)